MFGWTIFILTVLFLSFKIFFSGVFISFSRPVEMLDGASQVLTALK